VGKKRRGVRFGVRGGPEGCGAGAEESSLVESDSQRIVWPEGCQVLLTLYGRFRPRCWRSLDGVWR
jgi:hypothetical protein